jgi:hypothetical protein
MFQITYTIFESFYFPSNVIDVAIPRENLPSRKWVFRAIPGSIHRPAVGGKIVMAVLIGANGLWSPLRSRGRSLLLRQTPFGSSGVIQTTGAMTGLMMWNLVQRKNEKGKPIKVLPVIVAWEHLCGGQYCELHGNWFAVAGALRGRIWRH